MKIFWMYDWILNIFITFIVIPIEKSPHKEPNIEPTPPASVVPPNNTAAITFNAVFSPIIGDPVFNRAANIIPAKPAKKPQMA